MGSWAQWAGQSEYHGHDGFMEWFAERTDPYDEWTQEFGSFVDAGGSYVVVSARQRARSKGTDTWVTLRLGFVYTVEDGLVVRIEVYESPAEALEAAKLRR